MEPQTSMPEWLSESPSTPDLPALSPGQRKVLLRQVEHQLFENAFEHIIDEVEDGKTFSAVIKKDPRNINLGRFMRWAKRDPERAKRIREAEKSLSEAILGEMIDIADAKDSMVDVKRSELMLNTRWKVLSILDCDRFGKNADQSSSSPVINVTISGYENTTVEGNTIESTSVVVDG